VSASFAIDTLLLVDEQHRFTFMKAVARANDNAICVLAVKTWFSNNVSHGSLPKQDLESGLHLADAKRCLMTGQKNPLESRIR